MRIGAGNLDFGKLARFHFFCVIDINHTVDFGGIGGAACDSFVFPYLVHQHGHALADFSGKARSTDFFLHRHKSGAAFLFDLFRNMIG